MVRKRLRYMHIIKLFIFKCNIPKDQLKQNKLKEINLSGNINLSHFKRKKKNCKIKIILFLTNLYLLFPYK